MSAFVIIAMTASALGWGGLVLRVAGVRPVGRAELFALSFILGQGAIGWLAFWPAAAGWLSWPMMAALLGGGIAALVPLVRDCQHLGVARSQQGAAFWMLVAVAGLIGLGDLLEALSPPADADSLAYHFVFARHIGETGRLAFVPRAVDGAVSQLTHLLFGFANGLGGEPAMTLWAMVSGWGAAFATYAVGRRWLQASWALATALVVASMPAMLFGAGTGQVEARCAAFALVAAVVGADALARRSWRAAVVAGLAAGFMAASKVTGLLLMFAVGAVLLAGRGGLVRAAAFSMAALAAGCQYYLWNWGHTGDPVFPLLWRWVRYADPGLWNAAQDAYFRQTFTAAEQVLPKTLFWWMAYPLRILADTNQVFEAGQTGFGPFPLVTLPFALAGAWLRRRDLARSPLLAAVVVAAIFYSLWFWLGVSQRVRHFLPVMPIVVLTLMVAAERASRGTPARLALAVGLAACLAIQAGGQAVFSRQHAERLVGGWSRNDFLARNVNDWRAAEWMNANLPAGAKVMHNRRELNYLLHVGSFQTNREQDARVEVRPDNHDPARFWAQVRAQGVTHVFHTLPAPDEKDGPGWLTVALERAGCSRELARFHESERLASRAIRLVTSIDETSVVWVLTPDSCLYPYKGQS